MKIRSKSLEDTAMWKTYSEAVPSDDPRSVWVHQIYEASTAYLKGVRESFPNYTLHDETHVLNVLDAMAGILGSEISNLSAGEAELLILAACLHDLGMVYAGDEAEQCFSDRGWTRDFLRENCPELLGCPAEEWPDDIRQWYLRSLHPFRLPEVLRNQGWKELFSERPAAIASMQCILAVCQAHGEDPEVFSKSGELEYLPASDADPLFCALLLRLADLLDFDDTRAPKVLYGYVACDEHSREEWDKHQASGGFRFPDVPSAARLPYKARCTDPGIEHTIRDFLDWIDAELIVCGKLRQKCHRDWQRSFPFPQAVERGEIESEGYVSGDFLMTMDQARVMDLLIGEQLYQRNDVFIRELLQNSIDATLLRAELDRDLSLEDARIDLWEWNDRDGNIWFRIDDQGNGMTLGMLKRYFLKIGNSYYTSQELKRDLRDHGHAEDYRAISRFGIGFLSCFMCGTFAEVSTLYFDSKKNLEEVGPLPPHRTAGHGLRLQVTGLRGYYTLKSQAEQHPVDEPMPAPDGYGDKAPPGLERGGYRAKPGTSISIRLDPGRMGAISLREAAEEYLCCAKIPVYYNGERIGRTYGETMEAAHQLEGERVYELTPEQRKRFDKAFPHCRGQYPRMYVTVVPLDTEENQVLTSLSGVLVKYDVRFDEAPCWEVKGRHYRVNATIGGGPFSLSFNVQNTDFDDDDDGWEWDDLIRGHSPQEIEALGAALGQMPCAPACAGELGEVWLPFADNDISPGSAWRLWADSLQESRLSIPIRELGVPAVDIFTAGRKDIMSICSYRGIVADDMGRYGYHMSPIAYSLLLLLDNELRPTVKTSRSGISNMPLELVVAICGILGAWAADLKDFFRIWDWKTPPLSAWRRLRGTRLERWLWDNLRSHFDCVMEELRRPMFSEGEQVFCIGSSWPKTENILQAFLAAQLQDMYRMEVNYEEGQVITLSAQDASDQGAEGEAGPYDLFPPMMFCTAATQSSRRFLCCGASGLRRCITADHPYALWLLKNAMALNEYYGRQFEQIVNALCHSDTTNTIHMCNGIREQLLSLAEHHGIDIAGCPRLSEDDFWMPADET